MFQGTIPQDLRNHLYQIVQTWPVDTIYVGCSGNFTVERVLATLGSFRLHSNDVSIYTCALGALLAGQPFRLELRAAQRADFGWLESSLVTPADKVATLMLGTRLVEALGRDGKVKENAYYARLLPAYREQWPQLHAATVKKLEALSLKIESFHAGDVAPWVRELPKAAGFVSYPPFYVGGYESLFGKLDLLFDWDAPAYDLLDEEGLVRLVEDITDRPYWLFGSNRAWPELRAQLVGVAQTSNRGVPVFVYAAQGPTRVVVPQQHIEPVLQPRLVSGHSIGRRIALGRLNAGQFAALRSQYLSPRIRPGQTSDAFAVMVDGHLIGAFAFSAGMGFSGAHGSEIYLLSDFAVAPTDYPRLSKLVLYAALSREAKLLAERITRHRVRTVFTTAFSDKPVSMKYRGLFDLYSRKTNPNWSAPAKNDPGAYYQQQYLLNYVARAGQWTLAEGFDGWKANHGERRNRNAAVED